MGIRAPTAWAELQHHGRQTLPPGTQRGLQPTNWYIWEHLTGAPRFPLGLGGDMDIRNDDRGAVDAVGRFEAIRPRRPVAALIGCRCGDQIFLFVCALPFFLPRIAV